MVDLIAICCLGLYFAFPFVVVIVLVVTLIYLMLRDSEVKLIKND
ncbi:hypothetical protein [Clostridium chromiireducens]|nr:hypothetical protein [Clostridium chromiireducens]